MIENIPISEDLSTEDIMTQQFPSIPDAQDRLITAPSLIDAANALYRFGVQNGLWANLEGEKVEGMKKAVERWGFELE